MKKAYILLLAITWFACKKDLSAEAATGTTANGTMNDYFIFSINVQDFSYPNESAAIVNKIIDLHEQYKLPVDIYLTTTMVDIYEQQYPSLLNRLKTSAYVSVCYHTRPPLPYYTNYNWMKMDTMTDTQKYNTIMRYETHGLNLTTGQTTDATGGFGKLKTVLGYTPVVAACFPDEAAGAAPFTVYKDLGAKMFIDHGKTINLGDKKENLPLRPEHYDLKLFEQASSSTDSIANNALQTAHTATGAKAPYFIGVKMHDNDFFADSSAWLTVYNKRVPNWDITRKSALISTAEQTTMWNAYSNMVKYAATHTSTIKTISTKDVLNML